MGHPLLLPLLLLLLHTGVPASWGLRCIQCNGHGNCRVEECALGQNLCRTTSVRHWEEGEEVEMVEKSCTHSEKTNRTMSFRTGVRITTLTEAVCGLDLCNQDSSGRPKDDHHIRGCGHLPGCPGIAGFHSEDTFHFLKCCNTTKCNGGPILSLANLPKNGHRCYSCQGNSTHGCSSENTVLTDCRGPMNQCLEATGIYEPLSESYMVRGCATSSMCQHDHVSDAFSMSHIDVACCTENDCNNPAEDIQHRSEAAPPPGPAHLSLTITGLMTARLWGGTLLWT
ncbi:urokinase plasminogen activator surface receptor isoform X2 [Aotus nancymaae]|uniref:urokinase plasminogen activator surface receptor isoform X2 n=1 Tax=Aotus nancymaae TaxID=37293 RepID=UPI0030FE770A